EGGAILRSWLVNKRISVLGFSYRLDTADALRLFEILYGFLRRENLLFAQGGRIRALFFAGLPDSCAELSKRHPELAGFFSGDETPQETVEKLGIPAEILPPEFLSGIKYDAARIAFGEMVVKSGEYRKVRPVDRSSSPGFGKRGERLQDRISHGIQRGLPPLMRAHAGPYLADRLEAVRLFKDWARSLASGGYLDVLSIGTSQLSQSNFGEAWEGKPDGGGVPLASPEEFVSIWEASRPMFVRSYSGSRNVPAMAKMLESTIDIAWHALSLWWFCVLDGRGPNSVQANLEEHFQALRWIASSGKPFEPNVPHHFAFRGSDDLGYVVSGFVAAKVAKIQGIRTLVLQTMLNTPKSTWGVQDLAKARALLRLVRELEDPSFKVYLQPRGGLDYFSPDPFKAKVQLAAVTALMDDIEPKDPSSPQIIHVVGYSEGSRLADPDVIEESVKITRYALGEYRRMRASGEVEDMAFSTEAAARETSLYSDAKAMIKALENLIPNTYSPSGLYTMLASGAFALPGLTNCREEFESALIPTHLVDGRVIAVDPEGKVLSVADRIEILTSNLARGRKGRKDG
ncbi:MAG TPA: hypothetical protein VIO60_04885, partial [Rectinemataceae bacterium]